MHRWRTLRAALPAWLLLALMFAAFYDGFPSARAVAKGAALATVTAASALALWWVSGRVPWPARVTYRTYLAHVTLAAAYGVLWTFLDLAQASLIAWENRFRFMSVELVLYGMIIYAVAMCLFYAMRAHERARANALAAARARLDALRARLHPHFLYNALHGLSALVRHDPDLAEEAIERLGRTLRYVLDREEDGVSLCTEWRFVEDYLAIERLRLGDRLRLTADFDAESGDCLVPPLCLQPLVENAIRHAIAPRAEGGWIDIRARVDGEYLRITVRDDGPGASAEAVESGRGLGLEALRERMRAWTVDTHAGELAITTAPGRGFTAVVTLPV
jgi:two-component system LytT family sensor kinase